MKIYIAGKITGLPLDAVRRKFKAAEEAISKAGHIPINPMLMEDWNLEHKRYISIARNILCDPGTDAIFMLHDWKQSPGALEEHRIAEMVGLKVYYYSDLKRKERVNEQTAM